MGLGVSWRTLIGYLRHALAVRTLDDIVELRARRRPLRE
jgi:hypothetical protein